jgi:hypothetical protein
VNVPLESNEMPVVRTRARRVGLLLVTPITWLTLFFGLLAVQWHSVEARLFFSLLFVFGVVLTGRDYRVLASKGLPPQKSND